MHLDRRSPAASTASARAWPPRPPSARASRTAGRLLGALALVGLVVPLLTAVAAGAGCALVGGFDLGDEPGRTLHAQFTWAEVLQPVALALLAVAVGAAAGPPARAPGHRDAAAVRRAGSRS